MSIFHVKITEYNWRTDEKTVTNMKFGSREAADDFIEMALETDGDLEVEILEDRMDEVMKMLEEEEK